MYKSHSSRRMHHIPSGVERQEIQCDNNTHYRVKLHHIANKYVLKIQKLGPTLGAIQTRPQNQRNPNAPTFEERSIEWDEIARKTSLFLQNNVYKVSGSYSDTNNVYTFKSNVGSGRIPGSYSENRQRFCKPSPARSVSSPCITTSEERMHSGRLEADTSCGRQRATCGHGNTRTSQPFTEALTRGSSSATDVSPTDVAIPPSAIPPSAHPPPKLSSNDMQTPDSYEGAMQQKS